MCLAILEVSKGQNSLPVGMSGRDRAYWRESLIIQGAILYPCCPQKCPHIWVGPVQYWIHSHERWPALAAGAESVLPTSIGISPATKYKLLSFIKASLHSLRRLMSTNLGEEFVCHCFYWIPAAHLSELFFPLLQIKHSEIWSLCPQKQATETLYLLVPMTTALIGLLKRRSLRPDLKSPASSSTCSL